ncbi:hypothetical protein SPC_0088 [Salmonella enterica subsp. enterica serovar Paratyphi C str. RKS4594]|uniref:Uncharacterized protein n=1 Tax=Salmonella paratyphi C (strain RKS4594) TaxID=476213 RepID=C0Q4M5_SALPC|nr:hypothetical protein SPC_0088 [Salmonella enterica subsp. enterica serovar Paratyphi C str. RKS4594]
MLRHNPLRAVWKQMLALFFINSSPGQASRWNVRAQAVSPA